MESVGEIKRKRKRSANTSNEQVEEYLKLMESDEVFRTNTINPTVAPDYIETSWENLATTLNSCGSGPVLSAKEWSKRFNDWKNNTRAKYRRIVENRLITGGGEGEVTNMTPQEERGLTVWGKVAVTGSSRVSVVGGLQIHNMASSITEESPSPTQREEPENVLEKETKAPVSSKQKDTAKNRPIRNRPIRNPPVRESRSTKTIGEELLAEYKKNNKNEGQLKLEEKKFDLEMAKFRFEVAKYKFENPTFSFNINQNDN